MLTGIGLIFTRGAARAAAAQTELQREVAREARLPKIWADIRPHPEHRALMTLFLGNSGPTVAHNVSVKITPRVTPGKQPLRCEEGQDEAEAGIAALPPGRVIEWYLGVGHELLSAPGQADEFLLEIHGFADDGGELSDSFKVRFHEFQYSGISPGNLEQIAKSLENLVKGTTGLSSGPTIRNILAQIADQREPDSE